MSQPNAENHSGHAIEFEFHSPDFSPPEAELRYAQEKLETRLKKYGRHVLGVRVHVRDVNGPKGGNGMTCHLEARLAGMEPVNVEEQEHDLRAAIDIAIDRLGVVVGRHLERARDSRMDGGRKLAQDSKVAE
ncbi:MAG TPA: HPF/RaiA family ribosome-associated protein [Polyangia bacterium]